MELPFEETLEMKLQEHGLFINEMKQNGINEIDLFRHEVLFEMYIELYEAYKHNLHVSDALLKQIKCK